jgi:hypothetical protein
MVRTGKFTFFAPYFGFMKTRILSLTLLAAVIGCSKTPDPEPPVVGCNLTFNSTIYLLDVANCSSTGSQTLSGTSAALTASLVLNAGGTVGGVVTPPSITFLPSAANNINEIYYSNKTAPTVTVNGKTWTFSGEMFLATPSAGWSIAGTCNCTN